ncbi:talin-1-like protein [Anaeramoeba flamelloides]|uniref:Talin-1-like protein n=1 Tax=Anaeramoeba flamelloides TaxID=1746091 RepID=A0AAV7ZYJ7_9EUKA|nr:talin-1-like protein [Anaeramoeba flamelloides]
MSTLENSPHQIILKLIENGNTCMDKLLASLEENNEKQIDEITLTLASIGTDIVDNSLLADKEMVLFCQIDPKELENNSDMATEKLAKQLVDTILDLSDQCNIIITDQTNNEAFEKVIELMELFNQQCDSLKSNVNLFLEFVKLNDDQELATNEQQKELKEETSKESETVKEQETLPEILPEPDSLPDILPEPDSLPDILPEIGNETLPDILPEPDSLPDILPEIDSLPDILPEPDSLPDILPEPESIIQKETKKRKKRGKKSLIKSLPLPPTTTPPKKKEIEKENNNEINMNINLQQKKIDNKQVENKGSGGIKSPKISQRGGGGRAIGLGRGRGRGQSPKIPQRGGGGRGRAIGLGRGRGRGGVQSPKIPQRGRGRGRGGVQSPQIPRRGRGRGRGQSPEIPRRGRGRGRGRGSLPQIPKRGGRGRGRGVLPQIPQRGGRGRGRGRGVLPQIPQRGRGRGRGQGQGQVRRKAPEVPNTNVSQVNETKNENNEEDGNKIDNEEKKATKKGFIYVYLEDGMHKVLPITDLQKVSDIIKMVCEKEMITNHADYALVEKDGDFDRVFHINSNVWATLEKFRDLDYEKTKLVFKEKKNIKEKKATKKAFIYVYLRNGMHKVLPINDLQIIYDLIVLVCEKEMITNIDEYVLVEQVGEIDHVFDNNSNVWTTLQKFTDLDYEKTKIVFKDKKHIMSEGGHIVSKDFILGKVYLEDDSYKMLKIEQATTPQLLVQMICRKLLIDDHSKYTIFASDKGKRSNWKICNRNDKPIDLITNWESKRMPGKLFFDLVSKK